MKIGVRIWVSGMFIALSCQNREADIDASPAIESIYFPGVPTENVKLDQKTHTLTIQLPPVLDGGLRPIFRLTEGAKVLSGLTADGQIDIGYLCSCYRSSSSLNEYRNILIGNGAEKMGYNLVILPPKGPMKALPSEEKFTFSRSSERLDLSLPVENLYKNYRITTIYFTNTATGKTTRIYADGACLNGCLNEAANRLLFRLYAPIQRDLPPATYNIHVDTVEGIVRFSQELIVTD